MAGVAPDYLSEFFTIVRFIPADLRELGECSWHHHVARLIHAEGLHSQTVIVDVLATRYYTSDRLFELT